MASASGSQTETGAGGGYSTSSESDDSGIDETVLSVVGVGGKNRGGSFRETMEGLGDDVKRLGGGKWGWAGERGRGEHVLVEKRSTSSTSPASLRGTGGFRRLSGVMLQQEGSSTGHGHAHGERSWATALLDTLEGNSHHPSRERRKASSPAPHSAPFPRSTRSSPRPRSAAHPSGRTSPDVLPRPRLPSPPLTMDSIRSTWNPFPHFHIRQNLVAEVVILVVPLLFALYRLWSMTPTDVFPVIPSLPFELLLPFTLSIPFLALLRRPESAFHPPFTDARGYRDPAHADDGVAGALALPVLLCTAVWYDTYARADGLGSGVGIDGVKNLVHVWEANGIHATEVDAAGVEVLSSAREAAHALFTARYELVLLTFLNAVVLLGHLALSKTILRIEKLPKSNTKRFFGFFALATAISTFVGIFFALWNYFAPNGLPISPLETAATTYIQQCSFYVVSRFARRGFTLGELNTMTAAGNALCLEFWRLSRARWYYKRLHPSVPPTFRAPTPIVAFQAVLIPGAFLSGFLLSPLLVLSRSIASRPAHRLKWPTERSRHRRLLALGVALGLSIITIFFLGGWMSWILSPSHTLRKPWVWALEFLYYGDSDGVSHWPSRGVGGEKGVWWKSGRERGRGWRRIALIGYWATVISSAIGGWQTHLVRARRIRVRSETVKKGASGLGKDGSNQSNAGHDSSTPAASKLLLSPNTAHVTLAGGAGGRSSPSTSGVATTGGVGEVGGTARPEHRFGAEGARAEKAVHASLNMRRKFFHALAVLMFVPGIAVDPAFTSLCFSLAFTLFTFAEYARFFALYPLGAPLHIFFTEFVDSKDSGPVILSHFYLLTGCAGGLWLEGSGINRFTGVLVLGIGDSLASIVGKLVGRTRWPGTSKTVEGTAAFIVSVVLSAWFFRLIGIVESFSLPRYILATTLAALLEATSMQNDNLVIPLYMWSVVALLGI